ncbi:MAG: hypothetical protein P1U34_01105 [Coxiellaceae bacterium]|nr:hypothetical protein [Coxiellaceae bacterium]
MKHLPIFCSALLLAAVLPSSYAADQANKTQTAQVSANSALADAGNTASVAKAAQKPQANKEADNSIESKVEHRLKDWFHLGAALLKGA